MPEVVKTTVYKFDELSDKAKEKARAWSREATQGSTFWSDGVIEDAKQVAALMGIDIENIYFTGFWSQGDGACFNGSYSYKKGSVKAVKEHAPEDKKLHEIAQELYEVQRKNFYCAVADLTYRGPYCHEHSVTVEVRHKEDSWAIPRSIPDEDQGFIIGALRDLMRWIYRRLEEEWNYWDADERVDEAIRVNGYTFTDSGERFG